MFAAAFQISDLLQKPKLNVNTVSISTSPVVVTATAAAERREHALLCKEVVKVMPSWRRFSVDKHGTVHVREVSKPHWHGTAAPSQKGAISSAAQAEKLGKNRDSCRRLSDEHKPPPSARI